MTAHDRQSPRKFCCFLIFAPRLLVVVFFASRVCYEMLRLLFLTRGGPCRVRKTSLVSYKRVLLIS